MTKAFIQDKMSITQPHKGGRLSAYVTMKPRPNDSCNVCGKEPRRNGSQFGSACAAASKK